MEPVHAEAEHRPSRAERSVAEPAQRADPVGQGARRRAEQRIQARQGARARARALAQHARRDHGHEEHGHEQAGQQAGRERDPQPREGHAQLGLLGHEDQRQEDHDRGERGQRHGHGDVARAQHRGVARAVSLAVQARDVLHHAHGVVDQHADAQRDARHRQDVERAAGEVLEGDGQQGRDGDRERHAQGHAHAPQEDEQHQDGQEPAHDGGLLQLRQGRLDHVALQEEDHEADAAREHGIVLELLDRAAQVAADVDHVGLAVLGGHAEVGVAAVDDGDLVLDLLDARHAADVLHAQAVADGDLGDLLGAPEAHVAAQQDLASAVVDLAQRQHEVVAREPPDDLDQREAGRGQLVLVDQDAHRVGLHAPHLDLAHALHRLEARDDVLLHQVVAPLDLAAQEDAEDGDRELVGGLGPDLGHLGRGGQRRPGALQAVAHFGARQVHVDRAGELDRDLHPVGHRPAAQLLDAGQGAQLLLDRPRHQLLVLVGARARVGDPDPHVRRGELRGEELDRDAQVGDQPQNQERQERHPHGDGTVDEHGVEAAPRAVLEPHGATSLTTRPRPARGAAPIPRRWSRWPG
jgi:hypothetical protein